MTMYQLTPEIGDAIYRHALAQYNESRRESCGVIVRSGGVDRYVPCQNTAEGSDSFRIAPGDWAMAEDAGEIVAVVHSHPDASAHPSDADRVMCNKTGLPWLIVSMPGGVILQTQPQSDLPLVGRQFHHGVVDCYTLVRDYYAQRLGIDLPDFERTDDWWDKGGNLYRDNFSVAGFVQVGTGDDTEPQQHDVLLMMVKANVENHAAVYADPHMGLILHHLHGRASGHDVWGGYWKRHTTAILRHKSLMEGA